MSTLIYSLIISQIITAYYLIIQSHPTNALG